MNREGSGTSWLPDSSPAAAFHLSVGSWNFMIHGSAFVRFTSQDAGNAGERGDSKFDGPSMIMFSASRPAGASGQLMFRTMLSLDPIVEGGAGYPLLFQSGETWQGIELIDRQHPHDLFGELAMSYSRTIGRDAEAFLYLGYPGEPALGPPAFLHRASAANNPDAPLGHHWQDSTHIAFGVATAGIRLGDVKLDGSVFTGREPNEERYGFDRPRLDSWSGRLSWNPDADWSLQVSHGFLRGPEAIAPDVDVQRTTASAIHNLAMPNGRNIISALVWGWNRDSEERSTHAFLLESTFDWGQQAIYARAEVVQKTGHDLGLEAPENEAFWVNAWTLGTARNLSPFDGLGLCLGGQITVSAVPRALRPEYGRFPISLSVYLRILPARMSPSAGQSSHTHN
ncbi:MAG: hypothetical protein ACXWG5_02975 [Candidatus Aminicenantales bacterium]